MNRAQIEKKETMLRLLPDAHSQTSLCDFAWYQGSSGSYWYTWPHVDLAEEEESEPTEYFAAAVVYVSKEKFDLSNISDSLDCLFEMEEASKVDVDKAMNALVFGPITREANLGYKRVEPEGYLLLRLGQRQGNHFYLINKSPEEVRSLYGRG